MVFFLGVLVAILPRSPSPLAAARNTYIQSSLALKPMTQDTPLLASHSNPVKIGACEDGGALHPRRGPGDPATSGRSSRLFTAPATSSSFGSVQTLAVRLGSLCRSAACAVRSGTPALERHASARAHTYAHAHTTQYATACPRAHAFSAPPLRLRASAYAIRRLSPRAQSPIPSPFYSVFLPIPPSPSAYRISPSAFRLPQCPIPSPQSLSSPTLSRAPRADPRGR
jgi:hypothetical protein